MEAISAKAGGVSCSECAKRSAGLKVPVAIQLEELPVDVQRYDNPMNVEGEAKRVDRETAPSREPFRRCRKLRGVRRSLCRACCFDLAIRLTI
jgi:hypothetical protein